ncbi:hypothetical protein BH11MYX4_BH11MYX4_60090 [soil metagenome]
MTRFAISVLLLTTAACSSWDTGTPSDREGERACLDTVEALARAVERCGGEYRRAYDKALADVANGDCKNVATVRDEASLRDVCLPSLATEDCKKVEANDHDPTCSKQLQRPL